MTRIENIEKAVIRSSPDELARLRAWFDAFDAEQFDNKIERDAHAGRLDGLAESAIADLRSGRTRDI